jgi:hypothetical protein
MNFENMVGVLIFTEKVYENKEIHISDYTKIILSEKTMEEVTSISQITTKIKNIDVYDFKKSQNGKLICLNLFVSK